jgi:hypothetical protein
MARRQVWFKPFCWPGSGPGDGQRTMRSLTPAPAPMLIAMREPGCASEIAESFRRLTISRQVTILHGSFYRLPDRTE